MKRIFVIYFEAASGHRSAAQAIASEWNERNQDCYAEAIDLLEITKFYPAWGRIVKAGINYFNFCLKKDLLFDLGGLINLSLLIHDSVGKKGIAKLSEYWKDKAPDLVISVTPMYNPAIFKSLRAVHEQVPYLIVPVDMEEAKKRYWFTPKFKFHYATASPKLTNQAKRKGIEPAYLHPLNGMPAPALNQGNTLNKDELFKQWGFNPNWPTCMVSFGGQGTVEVLRIAKQAIAQATEANFLFMCGKNKSLFETIKNLATPYPKKAFSYLPQSPTDYLQLSDILIGKPGAMTLAEAQLANKKFMALKSTGLNLVQKGNEDYIQNQAIGEVFPSINKLVAAISKTKNINETITQKASANTGMEDLIQVINALLILNPAQIKHSPLINVKSSNQNAS